MTFVVMRHGRTDYNNRHLLQGQMDIPLNEEGVQEALNAREELKQYGISLDRAISSPLDRALTTASLVSGFPKAEIPTDDRLKEIAFGALEGTHTKELSEDMRTYFEDPVHYIPPEGAESYAHLLGRMESFLNSHVQENSKDTVLVLSHGAALHAMYQVLTGNTLEHFWDKAIGNCGYFLISNQTGKWVITEEHLHGEAWVDYVKT